LLLHIKDLAKSSLFCYNMQESKSKADVNTSKDYGHTDNQTLKAQAKS